MREYVIVIIVVCVVVGGFVVISIVVCYCCCNFVDTPCKCCLTHRHRSRRFSGESMELFTHPIPENLPNLRYRVKDM